MASFTTAKHFHVIDAQRRTPRQRRVARVATIGRSNVARRFTRCGRAVVACGTRSRFYLGMVDGQYRHPRRRLMALLTLV